MKKTREIDVCDLCEKEEDYLKTCCICDKLYCNKCSQDDTWRFTDTSLCENCNGLVWKEFPKLFKQIKDSINKKKEKK